MVSIKVFEDGLDSPGHGLGGLVKLDAQPRESFILRGAVVGVEHPHGALSDAAQENLSVLLGLEGTGEEEDDFRVGLALGSDGEPPESGYY